MFREILERPESLDPFKEDYIAFKIDEESRHGQEGVFLLYFEETVEGKKEKVRRDFMISKESLREIRKKIPDKSCRPPVLHEYGCIKISRDAYPLIVGKHLKPMDTECMESEF